MRGFMTGCVCFWALIAAVLVPANGTAADSEQRDGQFTMNEVVVTATKTDIRRLETGASITVVTEKEMEQRGKKTVVEALRGTPGITVSRTGVAGGLSSVFLRGGNANQVVVLVDGVRMNDPSSPDGAYDFANMTADNVARIEVVRGAQSTLYGSFATGGVINIITKKGRGEPRANVSIEAGSFGTFRESLNLSGGDEKADYSFGISRTDMRGISKAAEMEGSTTDYDRDGYENTTLSTRLGCRVFDKGRIELVVRYFNAEYDMDTGAYLDDPNNTNQTKQFSARAAYTQEIFGFWKQSISGDYMNILRRYNDEVDAANPTTFSNSWYEGTHEHAEWQQILKVGTVDEITAGLEIEQDSYSSLSHSDWSTTEFDEETVVTKAGYLQNHMKLFKRVYAIAGVRVTDHEEFGAHTNYQLSGSVLVPFVETRLKGNYATGFRAPGLYQLYDPTYGNKELDPEESRSYDYGIEQALFGDRFLVELTYFNTRYKNMITTKSSKYVNVQRFITDGIEVTAKIIPGDFLSIVGSYTYTRRADDLEKDERLIRRPKHQGSMYVNLFLFNRLNINAGINYVGERKDTWYDTRILPYGASVYPEMDDYYLLSLGASFQITENFQVFGRVENAIDEDYQEVAGYRMPGRAFYGGVKGTF